MISSWNSLICAILGIIAVGLIKLRYVEYAIVEYKPQCECGTLHILIIVIMTWNKNGNEQVGFSQSCVTVFSGVPRPRELACRHKSPSFDEFSNSKKVLT